MPQSNDILYLITYAKAQGHYTRPSKDIDAYSAHPASPSLLWCLISTCMGAQGAKQKCVAESRSVTHPCPFLVFKFIFEKLVPLQCLSNSLGRIFLCALGHMSSPARLHGRHTVRFLSRTILLQLCLNIFLVVVLSLKVKFPNNEMSFQRSDGCTVVIQAYNKNRFALLQSILHPYETSEFVKHIIIKTNYSFTDFAHQFANTRKLKIIKTDVLGHVPFCTILLAQSFWKILCVRMRARRVLKILSFGINYGSQRMMWWWVDCAILWS